MKNLQILICNYILKYAQLLKSSFNAKFEFQKFGIFWVNFHKSADSEKLQRSIFTKHNRKTLE